MEQLLTKRVCCICSQVIRHDEEGPSDDDVQTHQLCYDIVGLELERELLIQQIGDALRANPDYEEIKPGVWQRRKKSERCGHFVSCIKRNSDHPF